MKREPAQQVAVDRPRAAKLLAHPATMCQRPTPASHQSPITFGDLRGWIEEYSDYLTCWMRARCGPALRRTLEVEDLVQEVWVRAATVRRGRPVTNPRGWLLAISGFVLLEAVRGLQQRSRVVTVADDDSLFGRADSATSLTRRIVRDEARQRFFAELGSLAEDEWQLLVLHGMEGRPMASVAAHLGIATEAAHKRWQRLRVRLRDMGAPSDLL